MREQDKGELERYPLNAEGPFYVEKDACLSCMVPEYEAPELMGYDAENCHCYFKRQPATPEELEHAISAVAASDVGALRSGGDEPYVLERLGGCEYACDALRPKRGSEEAAEEY